jgi:hypothetical protein
MGSSGESEEPSPDSMQARDMSRAPSLETRYERAICEPAPENTDLYKHINHLKAELRLKDARFEARPGEMA